MSGPVGNLVGGAIYQVRHLERVALNTSYPAIVSHVGRLLPKLLLVSRLQALLHEGRLKIHKEIPDAAVLVRELQDFRVEYTAAGSLTFNARSGRHDDLVLALAIAVWVAHGGSMSNFGIWDLYRQRAGGVL